MKVSRRTFIRASSAYAGIHFLPAHVWANSPNEKVCVAHIGVGNMGENDLTTVAQHPKVRIVGLCDVDSTYLESASARFPDARKHKDYRELLPALGDQVDAVVVSTPDHSHAPAAIAAMQRKKHVYCQKPLSHSIAESFEMHALAEKNQLTTQMGIQVHSGVAYRTAVDAVRSGIIGKICKVYVWSNKSWGDDSPPYPGADPVPDSLDWNLWLGTAPERPYLTGKYHPEQWRKILDFGCGTLGDMGVHIFDTPMTALELQFATSVQATCREPNGFSHPAKNIFAYTFPGTKYTTREVTFTWFDGAYAPSAQPTDNPDLQLPDNKKLPDQGAMFIGEHGGRILLPHVGGPQFLPRTLTPGFTKPVLEPLDHYHLWIDAILGTAQCNTGFDYAHILTVNSLLGVVATRFPGKTLQWDAQQRCFTNHPPANDLLSLSRRHF